MIKEKSVAQNIVAKNLPFRNQLLLDEIKNFYVYVRALVIMHTKIPLSVRKMIFILRKLIDAHRDELMQYAQVADKEYREFVAAEKVSNKKLFDYGLENPLELTPEIAQAVVANNNTLLQSKQGQGGRKA